MGCGAAHARLDQRHTHPLTSPPLTSRHPLPTPIPTPAGIGERDYTKAMPAPALRKLFGSIGYAMSDAEFLAIHSRAAATGVVTPAGAVCIQEFKDVMNEVLSARDAGEEPAWFTQAVDGQ